MIKRVLDVPYAIDLGNGFTKRMTQQGAIIEPSVIGNQPNYWNEEGYDVLSFNGSEPYYIGDDVINAGITPIPALGDDDASRYESEEFKKLLFGFIARDFKESVIIPLLVTGLPVAHFKAKGKYLTEMIKGVKVVNINGKDVVIEVKKVVVLPQPIGTYMYLVGKGDIKPTDEYTLIVDGGYGTVDITEMKGKSIVKRAGDEIGVKNAYIEIYNYLVDRFGNMRNLSVSNMPYILKNGLKVEGTPINVAQIGDIQRILEAHFNEVFSFIRNNRFDLKSYDKVVFTGGMALLHRHLIEAKERANFIVIDEAQVANCLGYWEYGKAVLASEAKAKS